MKIMYIVYKVFSKVGQKISYRINKNRIDKNRINKNNNLNYYELDSDRLFKSFKRLPESITKQYSKGIWVNSQYSAGLKLGFVTASSIVNIKILYKKKSVFNHMSIKGISGVDVYVKNDSSYKWITCISPLSNIEMIAECELDLQKGDKQVELFLPPFAQIERILVGVDHDYKLNMVTNSYNDSILIYGSSISQGSAASRPSMSYGNIIARKLKCDIVNMGFSESAKGEEELINYIASINSKVIIMEYDHNVTVEELKKTHYNVYEIFRKYNQNSLIIMMTRFSGGLSITLSEERQRIAIVKETFERAINNGDYNVEIVYGNNIFPSCKDDYFVDDRHPNDIGMMLIAECICDVIWKRGLYD
ncbi:SGNH/GDSL hydrolase family protein [Lacrimispora sp. BS-2]|uniref:SGNH/GDSL hydrolase family protein n=1 Tax=Lacrimispora sp. BS-2 TaxID=3151850 RepID=A0AAU7PQA2_9FIRM